MCATPTFSLHFSLFNTVYHDAFNHSQWGLTFGECSEDDPAFLKLDCHSFVFLSLPNISSSVVAHSMFHSFSSDSSPDFQSSPTNGNVWQVRSVTGTCRACSSCFTGGERSACPNECTSIAYKYDSATYSLEVATSDFDSNFLIRPSDDDIAELIRPTVMLHSTKRVSLRDMWLQRKLDLSPQELTQYMYDVCCDVPCIHNHHAAAFSRH